MLLYSFYEHKNTATIIMHDEMLINAHGTVSGTTIQGFDDDFIISQDTASETSQVLSPVFFSIVLPFISQNLSSLFCVSASFLHSYSDNKMIFLPVICVK